MLDTLTKDLRYQYEMGGVMVKIIMINIAVFVCLNLLKVFNIMFAGGGEPKVYEFVFKMLSQDAQFPQFLLKPWTLITHMFTHVGFFHVAFNMLILYWFGQIIINLLGERHVIPLYIMGGLTGVSVYIISAQLLSAVGMYGAHGASAAVMAFVVAAATLAPYKEMRLMFIGNVKLMYIAAAMIFIDFLQATMSYNTGGHLAHLGGALFGYFYIAQLQKGKDLSQIFVKDAVKLKNQRKSNSGTKKQTKVVAFQRKKERTPSSDAERIDLILDKIRKNGLESLTPEERDFLDSKSGE